MNEALIPTNPNDLTLREYFNSEYMIERFSAALGTSSAARAYIGSVLTLVGNDDRLLECSKSSIAVSALRAATLRLSVDPSVGHAYLIPYRIKGEMVCVFQPGYRGVHHMALRTRRYEALNVSEIFEGQTWEEDQITGKIKLSGFPDKSKPVIAYSGYFKMAGYFGGMEKTIVMTVEEIHAHKEKYSKGYERSDSAWKTATSQMERKTVLLRLLRDWGYIDPIDQANLEAFDKEEIAELDEITVEDLGVQAPRSLDENLAAITGGDYQTKAREASGQIRGETIEVKVKDAPTKANARVRVAVEDLNFYRVVRSMAWAGKTAAHNPMDRPDVYFTAYVEDVLGYDKRQANEILEAYELDYKLAFLRCYLDQTPLEKIPERLFNQEGE